MTKKIETLKKPKKKSISKLKKMADRVFSKFIRKRDVENGGVCITCQKWFDYEMFDAGHFISRMCIPLRYEEKNVAAQCQRCNRYCQGEQALFAIAIDKKWGKGTAKKLLDIYQKSKSDVKKYGAEFYEEMYEKYKGWDK